MAKQAVKLSEYPLMPSNKKGEILYDSFFYVYANTNYGATYLRKNYQLSLDALRNDMRYSIGVNVLGTTKIINLWWGSWSHTNRNLSYVYEWDVGDALLPDYIEDKHGLKKDPHLPTNTFFLNTAPLPGDEEVNVYENEVFEDQIERNVKTFGTDPNAETTKLMTKEYVDERFKGFRKLYVFSDDETKQKEYAGYWNEVTNDLKIRSYTCYYIFDKVIEAKEGVDNPVINIVDPDHALLKDIFGQKLTIYICLRDLNDYYTPHPIVFMLNGEACNITWTYEEEWEEFYTKQPKTPDGYYTVRIELEVVKDTLSEEEVPYKYVGRAFTDTYKTQQAMGNNRELVTLTPSPFDSPQSGETYNISFGDFNIKKDYFVSLVDVLDATIISFDVESLGTGQIGKTYTWNLFIQTGNYVPSVCFGGDSNEIYWSLEDSVAYQPILQPNKLYCITLRKVLNEVGSLIETKLLANVDSYVNLVKPPIVDYSLTTTMANQKVYLDLLAPPEGVTYNYNAKIRWGDGSRQEVFYNGMATPSHRYATPGTYIVTVTGRIDGFVGNFS